MSDIAALIERARASVDAAGGTSGTNSAERLELQRVAQQFEGMLLSQMLREMRKAGEWKDGDEGEQGLGLGTQSFTEAIDSELGLHLARNGGLGLTSQLMHAFDRLAGTSPSNVDTKAEATLDPTVHETTAPVAPTVSVSEGEAELASVGPSQVTSAFGWRSDPFTGEARFHRGVDIRAVYGQDVQAAAAGKVVFSGEQRGYGTTVVIEHEDGSRSRYAHLSGTTVQVGADVDAGQTVGRAGKSGRATGTHLHFEVTTPAGEPISPSQWMQERATTA